MEQTYFENSKSVLNNIEDVVRSIDCKKENISITISDIQKREMFEIERVVYNYAGVHFVGKHGENIYLSFSDMSVLYNYNGVHFIGKRGENIYLSFSGISVFDICNIADELHLVCNKKCLIK